MEGTESERVQPVPRVAAAARAHARLRHEARVLLALPLVAPLLAVAVTVDAPRLDDDIVQLPHAIHRRVEEHRLCTAGRAGGGRS